MRMIRRLPVLRIAALFIAISAIGGDARQQKTTGFAAQIEALSEPGGYFDTDNLISNERSYLQVLPDLERPDVRGGAYVGVGPDQNFSYIARLRPSIAFILDIRRDNLLLHLLFKAVFEQARTRIEYLSLLFGRPMPGSAEHWRTDPVERLAEYIDAAPPERESLAARRERLETAIRRYGIPLSAGDMATIAKFHGTFIAAGLALRFESIGRPPQSHYPAYRDLLVATDALGRKGNFLATEDSFQFVKSLEGRDLVVPVVGNLAGPTALAAIGTVLKRRGEPLSAFYTSNVEFYLAREGTLDRFLDNLSRIPHKRGAVIIRSVFGGFGRGSTSVTESIDDVLAGAPSLKRELRQR
jgi:hypothetical protein